MEYVDKKTSSKSSKGRREKDVTVDELCKRFDSDLNFDRKTFEFGSRADDGNSAFPKSNKRGEFIQRIREILNSLLVFLWLASAFCVALYIVQIFQNLNFVDQREISLGIALAVAVAAIGVFTFSQVIEIFFCIYSEIIKKMCMT